MAKPRFVIDTTALISYHSETFDQPTRISNRGLSIIDQAFRYDSSIILIIPSVVFVEIFDKWFKGETLKDEEFRAKVRAEVIYPVLRAPNIEIRELDEEVLQVFLSLHYYNVNLENRDKIIMSYAVMLEAKLITSDEKIVQLNETNHLIDEVIE